MHVELTTICHCDVETLVREVKKSETTLRIAQPFVKFVPLPEYPLPEIWTEGKYLVKMRLFGFLPFGSQWIVVENDENSLLCDNGYSKLISKWHHTIQVEDCGKGAARYTDTVEIEAGVCTPFVTLFANAFFRWRQHRLKKLFA